MFSENVGVWECVLASLATLPWPLELRLKVQVTRALLKASARLLLPQSTQITEVRSPSPAAPWH